MSGEPNQIRESIGILQSIMNDPHVNEETREGIQKSLRGWGYDLRGRRQSLEDLCRVRKREIFELNAQKLEIDKLLQQLEEALKMSSR